VVYRSGGRWGHRGHRGGCEAYVQGGDRNDIIAAAAVGAVSGAVVGGTLGVFVPHLGAEVAAVAYGLGASSETASTIGAATIWTGTVGSAGVGGFGGSAASQAWVKGPSNIDYGDAAKAGLLAAGAAVFPAMVTAAVEISPVVYPIGQQLGETTITATADLFAGTASSMALGVAFGEDLATPPYDPDYPSVDFSAPLRDVYCSPKCY
jgi:hypothetical protein